jgi:hypothetical protein
VCVCVCVKIRSSDGGECEDYCLVARDSSSHSGSLTTFRREESTAFVVRVVADATFALKREVAGCSET